jgi:hypothetical protein
MLPDKSKRRRASGAVDELNSSSSPVGGAWADEMPAKDTTIQRARHIKKA